MKRKIMIGVMACLTAAAGIFCLSKWGNGPEGAEVYASENVSENAAEEFQEEFPEVFPEEALPADIVTLTEHMYGADTDSVTILINYDMQFEYDCTFADDILMTGETIDDCFASCVSYEGILKAEGMGSGSAEQDVLQGGKADVQTTSSFLERMEREFGAAMIPKEFTFALYGAITEKSQDTWLSVEPNILMAGFGVDGYDAKLERNELLQKTPHGIWEYLAMLQKTLQNAELAEDLTEIDGEECYRLCSTVSGNDLAFIVLMMEKVTNDTYTGNYYPAAWEQAADFETIARGLKVDVTCYISAGTGYVKRIELDLSDNDLWNIYNDYGFGRMLRDTEGIQDIRLAVQKLVLDFSDWNATRIDPEEEENAENTETIENNDNR